MRTASSQVQYDDVQANEVSLSYLHGDHLGSNSLMTDGSGAVVPNSQAAYLPFGDWRNEPGTSDLTDVGYTGHRHNNTAANDLGLIYMNARYYIPGIGRFASADTIIPDPSNPQSYNRFSYVLNSPFNYTDPSGHSYCEVIPEECVETEQGGVIDSASQETQYDLTAWLASEMIINLYSQEMQLLLEYLALDSAPATLLLSRAGASARPGLMANRGLWLDLTRDFGLWDLKREMEELGPGIILCGTSTCEWFDYSTPGNIHYGFLAAAAGISTEESGWAAGFLEVVGSLLGFGGDPGDLSTRFENPEDAAAVAFGYDLFHTYGSDMILSDFQAALTPEVMATFQKPSNFVAPIEAQPQENTYAPGSFNYD